MTKRPPKQPTPILADRIRRIVESPSPVGEIRPATSVLNIRSSRLPSFKTAKLVFPTGEAIDVVVKNLSATGARPSL